MRGIFNGTTNYMLTEMEGGMSYDDALEAGAGARLRRSRSRPPTWTAGTPRAKAIILAAALFGKKLTLDEMSVQGIRTDHAGGHRGGAGGGRALEADRGGDAGRRHRSRRRALPADHPLARVCGATNAITYSTDLLGEVTLIGAGAGRAQTGFGLLADLLDIHRKTY